MAWGSAPWVSARQNSATARVPAEVATSGAHRENASEAMSRNDATMTRSRWSCPASVVAQPLLIGRHGRGRGLDVEVESHWPGTRRAGPELRQRGGLRKSEIVRRPPPVGIGVGLESRGDVGTGGEPVGVVEGPDLGPGSGCGWHRVHWWCGRPFRRGPPPRCPSDVACTSSSMPVAPSSSARRMANSVDEGASPGPSLVGVGDERRPSHGFPGATAIDGKVASGHARPHPGGRHLPDPPRLEDALLQRQAVEERFQVDVFLGDVSWRPPTPSPVGEATPGPGRRLGGLGPPWSQKRLPVLVHRRKPPEDLPEVVVEITLRLQRLSAMPDSRRRPRLPARGEPGHRHRHPGAAPLPSSEQVHEPGQDPRYAWRPLTRAPSAWTRPASEGCRQPGRPAVSWPAGWPRSFVRLGDLRLAYLPPRPGSGDEGH